MNGVLVLDRVRVQGANAVAGLTWGFPSASAFTGFCHALDRRLRGDGLEGPELLGGCAIVCHEHQHLTVSHYGTHQFTLARAPLTKQAQTAPFNEEGRMHMTVSLLIEIGDGIDDFMDTMPEGGDDDESESDWFARRARDEAVTMRLAGGTILDIGSVRYRSQAGEGGEQKEDRKILFECLPGFALVDRSDLLSTHHEYCKSHDSDVTVLQAWMDFANLRFRCETLEDGRAEWARVPLPETGWFVPLAVGYQAIAPLFEPGEIEGTRDPSMPFRLVESVYGVGQWISPHRIRSLASLMWRHEYTNGRYLSVNHHDMSRRTPEEPA